MQIGYITFSAEEQLLVRKAIALANKGAIDELGLGRIRDTFSDELFPGMSTLHTRIKYFALLPSLYYQLSSKNVDLKNMPNEIRQLEINMTKQLINGNTEKGGIIGNSTTLDVAHFVKYTPTYIYLSALRYFGLVSEGNLYNLIALQSEENKKQPRKRTIEEELEDNYDLSSQSTNTNHYFYFFPGYDFNDISKQISLELTKSEAQILQSRIIDKSKGKLFSYLLQHDVKMESNFADLDIAAVNDEKIQRTYQLAIDFSRWAQVINTCYRYAFHSAAGHPQKANTLYSQIQELINSNKIPNKSRIDEILCFSGGKFKDVNGLSDFCKEASKCLDKNNIEDLTEIIRKREKRVKIQYAKIGVSKYSGETGLDDMAQLYDYRWSSIVYSAITDIKKALL